MPLKDSAGNVISIKKKGVGGAIASNPLSDFVPASATIGSTNQSILLKPSPQMRANEEYAVTKARKQAEKEFAPPENVTIKATYKNILGLKNKLNDLPYSGELVPGVPDVGRLKGKAKSLAAEQIPGFAPSLRTYNKVKDGFTGLMARTFGGEKGVMTDRDIERFVKFLPSYETTETERQDQWAIIDMMYNNLTEAKAIKDKNPDADVRAIIAPAGGLSVVVDGKVVKESQLPALSAPKKPKSDPLGVF